MKKFYLLPGIILLLSLRLPAQSHNPFQREIDTIEKRYSAKAGSENLVIFTGSSSIRLWRDLERTFPGKNVINTGFGGSQMSDLLFFARNTILKYKPAEVFIYEGDNDLAAGKKPSLIIAEADSLIGIIREILPATTIVFLSAKPSPLRWKLRDHYLELNRLYSLLPSKYNNLRYIDLWTPLIGSDGKPVRQYYLADSLHLNRMGYSVWAELVKKEIR
ncbi:MAG TPA: GDSL-type esterase/lipase family protein [Bacteroidales bacterium]|nr:GDSL-type esterase/lipase family protein [Bacteroidales bacterium]